MPLVACLAIVLASESASDRLARLGREYGLSIACGRVERTELIEIRRPKAADLDGFAAVLDAEWRRYPPKMVARTGLRQIVLGESLAVAGQPRAGVPDFGRRWLWLDVGSARRFPRYAAHVIHHEFFHLIDEVDSPQGRRDPVWASLNPREWRYGQGGDAMRDAGSGALRTDLPGFLTRYATSALEEDKAEVFAYLITNPVFVQRQVSVDPVLAAKVARMKALIRQFEPTMDGAWWPRRS